MSTSHIKRSVNLAAQICAKADQALANTELEMTLAKWPAEFRAVMWEAIADLAAIRAREARSA